MVSKNNMDNKDYKYDPFSKRIILALSYPGVTGIQDLIIVIYPYNTNEETPRIYGNFIGEFWDALFINMTVLIVFSSVSCFAQFSVNTVDTFC